MSTIAIIGGGLSGLTAAYELEKARQAGAPLDWHLYEASDRLGGIIETTRIASPEGDYMLEGGPDGWVSEKPWARELAIELGLGDDLIFSNDATRKTYIYLSSSRAPGSGTAARLQAMPDHLRLMVPDSLDALRTLEASPLFSDAAIRAYAAEPARAEELKQTAPSQDESIASFVLRHFGDEVLTRLAAPLLSGVFGGDVHKLSVRAVMPQFVQMEREHGSLILALEHAKRSRGNKPLQPIFTSLRRGVGSLVEALVAQLPPERIHRNTPVIDIADENRWIVVVDELDRTDRRRPKPLYADSFDHVILATSLDAARNLLVCVDADKHLERFLPTQASSAVLASFTWPANLATTFDIPPGFGFLVPQQEIPYQNTNPGAPSSPTASPSAKVGPLHAAPQLLACTFADQKFPHRAPAGARVLRAFFGSSSADRFAATPDAEIVAAALDHLSSILGPLPEPVHTAVCRWPRSLPQYEVGHLDRMAQLTRLVASVPGLTLLGNSYHGVGLPDLIRDARHAARKLVEQTVASA